MDIGPHNTRDTVIHHQTTEHINSNIFTYNTICYRTYLLWLSNSDNMHDRVRNEHTNNDQPNRRLLDSINES